MKRRLISLLLVAALCLGFVPSSAFASLEGPYATGEKEMIFLYSSMSGAGATQMDDWAMGEYPGVRETMEVEHGMDSAFLKTRLMVRAMHFNPWSDDTPIAYYIPRSSSGSNHELTLYGNVDVDPADISLTGVRLLGDIERHVYGDVDSEGYDGRLYWYTLPVFIPSNDVDMQILVKGELYATLPLIHVGGTSSVPLYTTMQVYDYEEGTEPETIRSMTLRVSGFSLPDDPRDYRYEWIPDTENYEETASIDGSTITGPDQYGYRYVTFNFFDEDTPSEGMIWGALYFNVDLRAFFFDRDNHLVNMGTEENPSYVFRTDYASGDDPYYLLAGGNADVPSPYYCIFKDPTGTPLADPEEDPSFALPGWETSKPTVTVSVTPGSYAGGQMALSMDSGETWGNWQDVVEKLPVTLPEYGLYRIALKFQKEGYKPYTCDAQKIEYNDGIAKAPEDGGVITQATGEPAGKQGSAFILTGEEDAAYTFYAYASPGKNLEAIFKKQDGTALLTRDMTWSEDNSQYELTLKRSLLKEAASVDLRVKAEADGQPGHELTLRLVTVEAAYVKALYDPTVPYTVAKDDSGKNFYAMEPGAQITGVFLAATGENRTHQMALTYTDLGGSTHTQTAAAVDDGKGQFTATIPLPEDTASLVKLSYELQYLGAREAGVDYDLSDYRVQAKTILTGIPETYQGVSFSLKGDKAERYQILPDLPTASLDLGDLPTGTYTYEFSGASGHIAGGKVSVTRGENIDLTGLPALGSLTVSTDGAEVNAEVQLTMTTPDGEEHHATGATGVRMEQIPVGTAAAVSLRYDSAAYPDVLSYTPEIQKVTIAGDETAAFTFHPLTYRTITGKLYKAGRNSYETQVYYTSFCFDQTVTRNGKKETVRFTGKTDFYGNFSVQIYDNVDAVMDILHVTYDLAEPVTVTGSGDQDLGDLLLDFSTELVVPVTLTLIPPKHVGSDLQPYKDAEGNTVDFGDTPIVAESAMIPITYMYIDSGGTSRGIKAGVDFDLEIEGGNQLLRFHDGVVTPGSKIKLYLSSTVFQYGDYTYQYGPATCEVKLDDNGNAVLDVQAARLGGEVRATVVEDNDEGLVGFLYVDNQFAYGTGELSVPYSSGLKWKSVKALIVHEEDAVAFADSLRSGMNPGAGAEVYVNTFPNNTIIHYDNLRPTKPSAVLGHYKLVYNVALSNRKGYALVTGSIEPRHPEELEGRVIKSILCNGENGAKLDYIFEGKEYSTNNDWQNTQDENGFYRSPDRFTFSAEVPISADNRVSLGFRLYMDTLKSVDAEGKAVYQRNGAQQVLGVDESLSIFDLTVPDNLIIREMQESQGKKDWLAPVSIRTFVSDVPEENEVTIWDNGTPIDTFTLTRGRYDSTVFKRNVRLKDNQNPGYHTLWATRQLDGETVMTYVQSLPVLMGNEHDKYVYVSNFNWLHWNHRIPNADYEWMSFSTLADLEGKDIWIWPVKKSSIFFDVQNATSKELQGVNFVWTAMVHHQGWNWYDNFGNHGDIWLDYWTTQECRLPCQHRGDWYNGGGSSWELYDVYFGYITGFKIEFVWKDGIDVESTGPSLEERVAADFEAQYQANGLGEVPDSLDAAEDIAAASDDALLETLSQDADLMPDIFKDLDLSVTKETDTSIRMEAAPTADVPAFSIELREGDVINNNTLWKLMEKEREEGSQNPDEKPEDGWEVYWAQMEDVSGNTAVRLAVLEEQLPDGRYHYVYHRSTYLPEEVAAVLDGDASTQAARDFIIERGDRGKKVYDTFNDYYTYTDLANTMYVNHMEKEMLTWSGSKDVAQKWGKECSVISDRAGKAMNILGVADTAYSFYKGPDGKDGSGLRQLLSYVKDEKFRRGIELQIRDYESMRKKIFASDMSLKTLSTGSNYVPGAGLVLKLAVFIGGLANGIISDQTKAFNQQVYDTTLMDIQRQIKFERYKASIPEAEAWLRAKMDSIYGKGNWSEYALAQERKLWVLVQDETGAVHYVWHEKAGNFKPLWDPSGFVFEGVEDNRVEGVSAELYFSDTLDESGNPIDFSRWTFADSTDQSNPVWTTESGQYGWMVPTGWWKVRYEKDGYLIAESKPMNVPPIHTTVNIGLLSTEAPQAAVSVGQKDITVAFTKYMQLESLIRLFGDQEYSGNTFDGSAFTVRFYDKNGVVIPGTVTFPDKTANTGYKADGYGRDVIDADWFVSTAVFTPADPKQDLTGATWTFADGMVSYSGVALDKTGAPTGLIPVTLDPGEGALRSTLIVTGADGTLPRLPSPVREDDYTFAGWFTPEGDEATLETVFTAPTTLTARWDAAQEDTSAYYTVTFDPGEGLMAFNDRTQLTGADGVLAALPTATREGYNLVGWFTEPTGGTQVTTKTVFTENTTVYAQYRDATENPFVDVAETAYYYTPVLWAVSKNITAGTDATHFSPAAGCTRGQVVSFLWRAAGKPEPTTTACPFTDVPETAYYYKAVLWAVENKITAGTSETTFSPNQTCTRGQIVSFLYRHAGSPEIAATENPFTDVAEKAYYYKSVMWAVANKITSGTTKTTFSPGDTCTRGQVVSFLYRDLKE